MELDGEEHGKDDEHRPGDRRVVGMYVSTSCIVGCRYPSDVLTSSYKRRYEWKRWSWMARSTARTMDITLTTDGGWGYY